MAIHMAGCAAHVLAGARGVRIRLAAAAVGLCVITSAASRSDADPVAVHDAFSDFSATSNPTPGNIWTYGWTSVLGGALSVYDSSSVSSNLNVWRRSSSGEPNVNHNGTGSPITDGGGQVFHPATEYLHLHPGSNGQYSIVRWIAPAAGTYAVSARFRSLRTGAGAASTDVHVLHNAVSLGNGYVSGYWSDGDALTIEQTIDASAGDAVDFSVGYGSNGYTSDSTGLAATITAAQPSSPPPAAPTELVATYSPSTGVLLAWTDNSSDELGFRIERLVAPYSWMLLAETTADVTTHEDRALFPSRTFTYRVHAYNAVGSSAWSNEASITTDAKEPLPAPPNAPTDLVAVPAGGAEVALTWRDNSSDELFFGVSCEPGGAPERAEILEKDRTDYTDGPLHPGWPYTWRVRALSLRGPSPWSNPATATLPGTLDLTLGKGALVNSAKPRRDKVKVSGTFAVHDAVGGPPFDPVANGVELQVGAANAPAFVTIAADDPGWKVRKSKLTWKSPKDSYEKVVLVFDTARSTWSASVSRANFADAPRTAVRVLVASGDASGGATATWVEGKPGQLRPE